MYLYVDARIKSRIKATYNASNRQTDFEINARSRLSIGHAGI